ncbi:MAG: hypothetical protein KF893_09995 [Caldilineaceae bacterium]|nr:hypothetical protein [Caldilineaceae bacterium]
MQPDLRNQLTSTVLAPLPSIPADGRGRRIVRRVVIAAIISLAFYLLVVTLIYRLLLPNGIGYLLYWLHDHVYLPIKGHTFTRFFPESLVWWLCAATVIVLWTLCWLADRSLVRGGHIWLLRQAVRRRWTHPWLLMTARGFARMGMQPTMLQAVTDHERVALIERMTPVPDNEPAGSVRRRIYALTRLAAYLRHPHTPAMPDPRTAHEIQEAGFLFDYHGEQRLQGRLLLIQPPKADWLQAAWAEPERWTPVALVSEIYLLLLIAAPDVQARWFGERPQAIPALADPLYFLSNAVAARSLHLESLHARLEQLWLRKSPGRRTAETFLPNESPSARALLGEMAMAVAVHTAWLTQSPHTALRFADAVTALKVTASLLMAEPETPLAALLAQITETLRTLPRPVDHVVTAQLLDDYQGERAQAWQRTQFARQDENPVQYRDLRLGVAQITALVQAAGPAYQLRNQEDA